MNTYKILCLEVIVLKYQMNQLKNEVEHLLIKIYIVVLLDKRLLVIFIKVFFITFTCNPYDKYHPFYLKFCTPFLPLNDKIMDNLKKVGKVYYENKEMFSGLGLFILRFTIQPFWNKLPEIQKNVIRNKKK